MAGLVRKCLNHWYSFTYKNGLKVAIFEPIMWVWGKLKKKVEVFNLLQAPKNIKFNARP